MIKFVIIFIIFYICVRYIRRSIEDKQQALLYTQYKNDNLIRLSLLKNHINDFNEQCEQLQTEKNQLVTENKLKREQLQQELIDYVRQCEKEKQQTDTQLNNAIDNAEQYCQSIRDKIVTWDAAYNNLIAPFQKIEKDKLERQRFCVSLTQTEKDDIIFLLKEVAPKMTNKDVIPKIIWSVYIQKPLAAVLQDLGAKEEPGIYKLTNILTQKSYIGQSTNVKKRLQDHYKSVCGISSISDQYVHQAMRDEGIDNFQIEIICYCDKTQLDEQEAFFIKRFNSQQYGYNILCGNTTENKIFELKEE